MKAYIGPRPRWWLPLVIAAVLMTVAVVCGYGLAQLVAVVASAPAPQVTPAPALPGPTAASSIAASPSPTPSASASEANASASAASRVHVVKPGEYVSQIARLYGVTPDAILRANNITDPNYIEVGQELVIPVEE